MYDFGNPSLAFSLSLPSSTVSFYALSLSLHFSFLYFFFYFPLFFLSLSLISLLPPSLLSFLFSLSHPFFSTTLSLRHFSYFFLPPSSCFLSFPLLLILFSLSLSQIAALHCLLKERERKPPTENLRVVFRPPPKKNVVRHHRFALSFTRA